MQLSSPSLQSLPLQQKSQPSPPQVTILQQLYVRELESIYHSCHPCRARLGLHPLWKCRLSWSLQLWKAVLSSLWPAHWIPHGRDFSWDNLGNDHRCRSPDGSLWWMLNWRVGPLLRFHPHLPVWGLVVRTLPLSARTGAMNTAAKSAGWGDAGMCSQPGWPLETQTLTFVKRPFLFSKPLRIHLLDTSPRAWFRNTSWASASIWPLPMVLHASASNVFTLIWNCFLLVTASKNTRLIAQGRVKRMWKQIIGDY